MYGFGIVKGLGVTIKHFINTYLDDIRWWRRRYLNEEAFAVRQSPKTRGVFTVQYPEEKLPTPERFRFLPFLVSNEADAEEHPGELWCTSCGICAKVCPPQCIWIERGSDPKTKRPIPHPKAFYIDIDLCMNCGLCAEFCPFDSIKMDHDYELAGYDRTTHHVYDMAKLAKPLHYWQHIAPKRAEAEAQLRRAKEARKEAKRQAAAQAKV